MSEDQLTLEVSSEQMSENSQELTASETILTNAVTETATEALVEVPSEVTPEAKQVTSSEESLESETSVPESVTASELNLPVSETAEVNSEAAPEVSAETPVKAPFVAKNKTRRPKTGQPKADQAKPAQAKKQRTDGEHGDQAVYKPEEIIQRLQGRAGVYRAYMFEVQTLLAHIKMVGLGPALAVLLAQTDHKSKRRIYWDISKWVFKEQKIKGKNNRSLMESIVYGDSKFLLKATHSVVRFLEDLDQLSRENPPQSTSGSQS